MTCCIKGIKYVRQCIACVQRNIIVDCNVQSYIMCRLLCTKKHYCRLLCTKLHYCQDVTVLFSCTIKVLKKFHVFPSWKSTKSKRLGVLTWVGASISLALLKYLYIEGFWWQPWVCSQHFKPINMVFQNALKHVTQRAFKQWTSTVGANMSRGP